MVNSTVVIAWLIVIGMKACIYEEYGSPEVMHLGEVDKPSPKRGEVLVRVHAASVTTADWRFRASSFPGGYWLAGRLLVGLFRPRHAVLGMDFSGVVAEVGPGVTRFRVGDAVFGAAPRGAHAEYVAMSESGAIVAKPSRISHEEAAAIPFGANSAFAFLRDVAKLDRGQRVLIIGASGGVGTWAVQIARHLGAEVTGSCSTRNVELVRSLGAHHVIDYTKGSSMGEGTYDVVFDTVGVTTFRQAKTALAPHGVYVPLNAGLGEMLQSVASMFGSGQKLKAGISKNTREGLELVSSLIEAGELRSVVDTVYPAERVVDAHRQVEGRHKRGGVILAFA